MLYFHFNISSKIWQRNTPDAFFPALYRCVRPQNRQINGLLGGKLNLSYHYLYIHIHLCVAQKTAARLMRLRLQYLFAIMLAATLLNKSPCTLDNVILFAATSQNALHWKSCKIIYYSKERGNILDPFDRASNANVWSCICVNEKHEIIKTEQRFFCMHGLSLDWLKWYNLYDKILYILKKLQFEYVKF